MDVVEARFLVSARGAELLARALEGRGADPLARRRALDAVATPEEARSVLGQDDLRARAARKLAHADRLLFTREALEQGSPAPVADERARRFAAYRTVADLGAGIGLDTLALARAGRRVRAVERDPARVVLLRHNVAAAGLADVVDVVEGDVTTATADADAAFLDPDRRPGGVRTRDPDGFEPPRSAWASLATRFGALLVKGAPAEPPGDGPDAPAEWVSLDGEARETRVGYGAFARRGATRTAVVLPAGGVLVGTGISWPAPRAPRVGDLLLDPDPAVVLAGLVGDAAAAIDAAPVHPRIAWLVADRSAPWATGLRIDELTSADPPTLRATAARHDVGALTVRTRGVEDPPEVWRRRVRPRGARPATIAVTRGPDDRWLVAWSV